MAPTIEEEGRNGICPVCREFVAGTFATHLRTHNKPDLITAIINQQDNLLLLSQALSKAASEGRTSVPKSAEPNSKCTTTFTKKATKKSGIQKSPDRNPGFSGSKESTPALDEPLSTVSAAPELLDKNLEPLILELENSTFEASEAETTEIMPTQQLCSFIPDPGLEDGPNDPNREFQTLYPIDRITETNALSTSPSHCDFIQYIIEAPMTGKDPNKQSAEWIYLDGRAIPVYSTLASPGSARRAIEEDPLSLDNESSSCHSKSREILRSHPTTQHEFDLMTDEEIPPRGEISEYEESNTSSHQSDELNKPGAMHIGSTLGSLFTNVRRIAPIPERELEKNTHGLIQPLLPVLESKCVQFGTSNRIQITSVTSLAPSAPLTTLVEATKSKAPPLPTSSSVVEHDRHKCPEANCSQVGSIFELAKHQEKVHQRKYKGVKKENSSQLNCSRQEAGSVLVDEKPVLTKTGKVRKVNKARKNKSAAFQCPYCMFYSDKLKVLHGHLEELHPGKPLKPRDYECGICGKMFQKNVNLKKHVLIHGVKKFQCECGKAFTSGFKLMEHARVHTKNYPFQCMQCDRFFRTPSLLKAHIARVHPIEGVTIPVVVKKLEFFCGLCSRILRSKRSYQKHLELHNETAQKCPTCYETFPNNGILTRHIRIAHDSSYETKESKDCPVCKKKMHPNSMKSHMRIHDNVKPFSCPICTKSFRTSANLTSHSWSHTNAEKPFKCSLCPKSYLFKKCLEAHIIVHKKRRFHFVCNECGMKFTSKVNLKRHCQEHFSEKKYKCNLCSKKFHRKYYLVEHERVHSGTKPFSCTICGKLSTTRSNHRAHIKIHDARESGTQEG